MEMGPQDQAESVLEGQAEELKAEDESSPRSTQGLSSGTTQLGSWCAGISRAPGTCPGAERTSEPAEAPFANDEGGGEYPAPLKGPSWVH